MPQFFFAHCTTTLNSTPSRSFFSNYVSRIFSLYTTAATITSHIYIFSIPLWQRVDCIDSRHRLCLRKPLICVFVFFSLFSPRVPALVDVALCLESVCTYGFPDVRIPIFEKVNLVVLYALAELTVFCSLRFSVDYCVALV